MDEHHPGDSSAAEAHLTAVLELLIAVRTLLEQAIDQLVEARYNL